MSKIRCLFSLNLLRNLPGLSSIGVCKRLNSTYFEQLGVRDRYGGVHIDLSKSSIISKEFVDNVIRVCNSSRPPFSAIWVTVPGEKFSLVPSLCLDPPKGPGLQFHHATGQTATLIRWLDDGPSKIPEYATHQLGVAGVLTNPERTHVLMVREKVGSRFPGWKFPTGLAHLGETIAEAVLREVYEECQVSAAFSGVVAFRQQHQHPGAFDRSDLLFICRLDLPPGSKGLPDVQPCQKELSDAKWMPLSSLDSAQVHSVIDEHSRDAFANSETIHITTITRKILNLILQNSKYPYVEFQSEHLPSIVRDHWYDLFLPHRRA